jgi:hypothetical protein
MADAPATLIHPGGAPPGTAMTRAQRAVARSTR